MRTTHKLQLAILFAVLLSGCARYKNMVLFNELTEQNVAKMQHSDTTQKQSVIKENYRLYIAFNGLNNANYQAISNNSSSGNINEASLYLNSYMVNAEGTISIPVLGKIQVINKTIQKAEDEIQQRTDEFFKDVEVDVRLLNFDISIIGDVKAPGRYTFYMEKVNVLEAITKAGGFSNLANYSRVMVMREMKGYTESYVLDLTDENSIGVDGFWLKPNDVVYIKPLPVKVLQINSQTISLVLSAITTTLLFVTYFGK